MTSSGAEAKKIWQDPEFAEEWVRSDRSGDLLDLPRRMAAAVVGADRPQPAVVVDVASGPGGFLEVLLEAFPKAQGIWSDVSEIMEKEARRRLDRFADRVEFRRGDMTNLGSIGLPSEVDVVVTSRAAHHLDAEELTRFYTSAASLLAPGGWLVNLDHIGPAPVWDQRLRAVRSQFVPQAEGTPKHHHNYPLTSVGEHLASYREAGIADVEVVWRAFYTCLFMGRSQSPGATPNGGENS